MNEGCQFIEKKLEELWYTFFEGWDWMAELSALKFSNRYQISIDHLHPIKKQMVQKKISKGSLAL